MTTPTHDPELSPCCGAPITADYDQPLGSEDSKYYCTCCWKEVKMDAQNKPYDDNECRHARRFDNRGVDTCKDCGATYNENALEWEGHSNDDF